MFILLPLFPLLFGILCFFSSLPYADSVADWRALASGTVMLEDNYLDQPYCTVWYATTLNGETLHTSPSATGRFVCTITRNNLTEGNKGEHTEILYSDDNGITWTTGTRLEPSTNITNAYGVILPTVYGRIFVIYNMNLDNVSHLPNGSPISRDDELGYFVARYSDDGGTTWNSPRLFVNYSSTAIDYNNSWKGKNHIMWSVDQVKARGNSTYHAFTKIGTYPQSPPEQIFILTSPNILFETDVTQIQWSTLPSTDANNDNGIMAPIPSTTNWEEGHIVPLFSSQGFFVLCRTNLGYLGASSTTDPTGRTGWTNPGTLMTYTGKFSESAEGRFVKNPQGPITLKRFSNGKYLFLYYNNGFPGYGERNPVFLATALEINNTIQLSQPEIILYDYVITVTNRPGYFDFIENAGQHIYITETNKTIARIHTIDPNLLALLWSQDTVNILSTDDLVLNFTSSSQGTIFTTPSLPDLSVYNGPVTGWTLGLWITNHQNSQTGDIILDTHTIKITVGTNLSLKINIMDYLSSSSTANLTMDTDCTVRLLDNSKAHYVVFILDGGSHILSMNVDGVLCDGGAEEIFGFAWIPATVTNLDTLKYNQFTLGGNSTLSNTYKGTIQSGQWYNRWLYNTEIIGNYRYGQANNGF